MTNLLMSTMASNLPKKLASTARALLCSLLALSMLGYGLDVGCLLSQNPCQTAECCMDCGVSTHKVDRPDQTQSPQFKFDLLAASSTRLVDLGEAQTGHSEFQDFQTLVLPRPVTHIEPSRGPPTTSLS